jgi:hypothetical protein
VPQSSRVICASELPLADQFLRSLFAHEQGNGIDDNGFTGAGLAGQHRQPSAELHGKGFEYVKFLIESSVSIK